MHLICIRFCLPHFFFSSSLLPRSTSSLSLSMYCLFLFLPHHFVGSRNRAFLLSLSRFLVLFHLSCPLPLAIYDLFISAFPFSFSWHSPDCRFFPFLIVAFIFFFLVLRCSIIIQAFLILSRHYFFVIASSFRLHSPSCRFFTFLVFSFPYFLILSRYLPSLHLTHSNNLFVQFIFILFPLLFI